MAPTAMAYVGSGKRMIVHDMSSPFDEAAFQVPTFQDTIASEARIRMCPPAATARGTFFLHVCEHVEQHVGVIPTEMFQGIDRPRWHAFASYPLRDFMRLLVQAAPVAFPNVSLGEGLRRFGRIAFPSFAATMAGRVVLFALGERIEDVVRATARAYPLTVSDAEVKVDLLPGRRAVFKMRRLYCFVENYHYGVLEGAYDAMGERVQLKQRRLPDPFDADFLASW